MRHSSSAILVLLLAGCASARSQPEAPGPEAAAQPSGVITLAEPAVDAEPPKATRAIVTTDACQTGDRMPVVRLDADAAALQPHTLPPGLTLQPRSVPMPNVCPVTAPGLPKRVPTGYVRPEATAPEP